jgi:hypothetical protein
MHKIGIAAAMPVAKLQKSAAVRLGKAAGRTLARTLLASAVFLGLSLSALANGTAPATGTARANPWTMCAKATNSIEREEGIPRQLLRAISKIEAGRYHAGKRVVMAWPWTVMAEGRGRYLSTKTAAIAEVRALQARGVRNIDVGCMQVNLLHHPDAFDSLEDAFDPLTNVTYAAGFLKSLAFEQGSWAKAVARYHSANPERYRLYRAKVHSTWRSEREKYLVALRQARQALQEPPAAAAAMPTEQSESLLLAALSFAAAPLPGGVADLPPARRPFPDRADAAPRRSGLAAALAAAQAAPVEEAPIALAFGQSGPVEVSHRFLEATR